ncbi:DNA-binding transcriptional LysR family regulator [Microvirga flocculans]|uniref:DNA-binding transcriptional LysR family regulator n=1 Tax=Microvirga flocculans TaxID=217168 RepID=A0A7W6IIA2_9HYPH|nr:LysR substrate-binding domain-containing protein [Microvirga flocculans]MBB4041961.1 DNA-binding transcriptional LysR family regulator [Microvirga flocculans]
MRNLNRFHLNGLRALEAAGRLGSLRAAAEELGVTVGAVSQQILKAEEQFGRSLFERHPKGLKPTAFGQDVLRYLSSGFAEISAGLALADRRREGVLTVSVAPVFASKWLVWRLQRFRERHPDIRIRIDADVSLVDPGHEDVDVCIRVGRGGWPNVKAERLLGQCVFPVCSPLLGERLRHPHDLAAVPIVREPTPMFGWNTWLGPNGLDESILGDGPVFSDASLCLDAAMAGQGVFLGWETLAGDAIALGRLVAPFPDRYDTGISYWFVTARSTPETRAVNAFRDWLKSELASHAATQ